MVLKLGARYTRLTTAVVVFALLAAALAGCTGGQKTATEQPKTPAAPKEVVVGSVFPLTGAEAKVGKAFEQATKLAVKEVNEKGGITINGTKVPVRLVGPLDDKTDPTVSAQLMEQLITKDKVNAVIGGYSTPLVYAQSVVPEKYGIPYVNGGGAATKIYGRGFKWIFGTLSPVEVLATTQMDFLKEYIDKGNLPKPLKLAVLWENTEHGKDYLAGVKDRMTKYPGYFDLKMDEGFDLYGKDFSSLLTKVKNAQADVFMVDAHLPDYITMHRQYAQMGLKHLMVTYGARGSEKDARKALGAAADYIFASNWWTDQLPYPQVKTFVEKWQKEYNAKPEWFHAIAYEAARMMLTGIEKAGSLEPEKIRQALVNLELKDSILPGQVLKFSQSGQAVYPFVVTENKPGGKVDIIYPADAATGPAVVPIPKQ